MKVCFKCGIPKELSEFYTHPRMADGHLNKCKSCTKEDVSERVRQNPEKVREYERERATQPHRVEARKEYRKSPNGKAAVKKAHQAYWGKNPTQRAATVMVSNAVRDGRLVKPGECSECQGTGRLEGHHDDYAFPLEVRWLCIKCHKDWHASNLPKNSG